MSPAGDPPAGPAGETGDLPRIFADALALPPEARGAFLDQACRGDDALRADVESLLSAHPAGDRFFGDEFSFAPPAEVLDRMAGMRLGSSVGPYELTRLIATGGMGSVYLGKRTDDAFRKDVAVKLVRPGLWGSEAVQRFKTERQVLASLEHPGIARLIDGGSTADGHPYLVMEYVDGVPIDRFCSERGLDVPARLALFLEVCDAVHYAHQNLVIHRDLKPSNIFVDGSGRVKLLDFGIARVLGEPHAGGLDVTGTTFHPHTPRYASPEQVAGRRMATATDIYSLGMVLYELLTGRFPYDLEGKTPSQVADTIAGANPIPPSRRATPERSRRLVGDLDMIILKALNKEPERRYPTVEEFGADIRRHLAGRPVHARPDTAAYRASKFVRRNKALVGGAVALVIVLAGALAMTLRAYHAAAVSKREAETQAYVASLAAAEASLLTDKVAEAASHLEGAPAGLRGWEWRHLRGRLDRSSTTFQAHEEGITRVAFSPDEGVFLTASIDSTVKVWRGATGALERVYGPFTSAVETATFVPGSTHLAVGLNDGAVLLVDRADGTSRILFPRGIIWALLSVSPDGRRLACGFLNGVVRTWSLPDGSPLAEWKAHRELAMTAYSPDGKALATAGGDGLIRIYDARSHRLLHELRGHARRVYCLDWSRDGSHLVTGSMDRTAIVWDARTGERLSTFREHHGTVSGVAFNAGGDLVVSSGADSRLLIWNAATGELISSLRGHRADVSAVAANETADQIITGDWGGTVRSWTWKTEDVRTLRTPTAAFAVPSIRHAALDPGGTTLVCAVQMAPLVAWRLDRQGPHRWMGDAFCRRAAFTPDGAHVVATTDSGQVLLFSAADSVPERAAVVHDGPVLGLAVDPGGTRIVTSADLLVRLWSLPALSLVREFNGHGGHVLDVEFSPSGTLIASCGEDGTIRVWEAASGRALHVMEAGEEAIQDIAFDPPGRRLVSASSDGSVRIWQIETGASTTLRERGGATMTAVTWSGDGDRIAVGGTDDIVRLFDVHSGREVVSLHGHVGRITSLRFTPSAALISTSIDGTVRLWETEPAHHTGAADAAGPHWDGPLASTSRIIPRGEESCSSIPITPAPTDTTRSGSSPTRWASTRSG